MQARDLFGVIVRVIGVALIIYGLYDVFYLAMSAFGIDDGQEYYPIELIASAAGFFLVLGGVVICCADRIVGWAYRNEAHSDPASSI
jgi:hypothetical protein